MSSPRNGAMSTLMLWNWIRRVGALAAMNTPRGPAGTLPVDSGADDHICHPDSAKRISIVKECEVVTERCARQSIVSP